MRFNIALGISTAVKARQGRSKCISWRLVSCISQRANRTAQFTKLLIYLHPTYQKRDWYCSATYPNLSLLNKLLHCFWLPLVIDFSSS